MINTENPNFENEFEQEILTKDQRFNNLKKLLSQDSDFKARLAVRNLQVAPYIPANISAGMGLIGQDIMEVDPRLIDNISRQVTAENTTMWSRFTDKLKGVGRGTFLAFDAGLDFVKGQLVARFPVEIGQRYSDKRSEGKTSSQAVGEIFDEFDDIRKEVGDTAFTLAIRSALKGEEINLGEGIIPRSTPIQDSDEYKELIKRGVNPEVALGIAEKMVGAPITDIARQQARTGVQFRGETAAGLTARGEVPFVTLGRIFTEPLVAMDIIEPGTTGYRNVSGSVDFVGTLALDPANWLLFGAGAAAKSAKSIKYVTEAQKAQSIAGGARKFVVGSDGINTLQQMGGIRGGIRKTVLERFPRLGGYSVEGFLQSNKGKNLIKFASQSDDVTKPAGNIDTLSSLLKSDDLSQLSKIARTTDEDDMYELLYKYFAGNIDEKIPFATRLFDSYKLGRGPNRTNQIFNKMVGAPADLAQFGLGPSIRYTNKWSPIVRLASKLYDSGYDPSNMEKSFVTLRNMMRQMDIAPDERARILREFADDIDQIPPVSDSTELALRTSQFEKVGDELLEVGVDLVEGQIVQPETTFNAANAIFKANASAVRAWRTKLTKEVGDDELSKKVIDKITRIYQKEWKEGGLNFVDEQGQAFNMGKAFSAYVNDEILDIPSFRLETELAQNWIPTIPPALMAKATNIFKKDVLGRNPLTKFQKNLNLDNDAIELMLDKYITGVWKPAVLLRGAWTVRVVGEEQVRLWAQGYDGLLSPRRWLALMTGKKLDPTGTLKILKKIDDGVSDTQIENIIFQEFPDLPKRFKFKGEEITMLQAIKKFMNSGDRDLLDIVNLTSKETEVMREFFDAMSGSVKGWQGLRKSNPNLASKGFAVFYKNDPGTRRGYINSMQTEYDQLMNDPLALKILEEGVEAAKEFVWRTRFDENSIANQISKQGEFYERVYRDQGFSDKLVDFVNGRIHIKTGGQINPETLSIIKTGNDELLNILKTGVYKETPIKNVGTTKGARKLYTRLFDEFEDVLPAALKGRGGTQYGEFAFQSKIGQGYDQVVENMFYFFMTYPTNKLSRSPVFKQAYWNKVASLIKSSDAQVKAGVIARAKKANVDSKLIKQMEKTVPAKWEDAIFTSKRNVDVGYVNYKEVFDAVDEVSKAHALSETKKLLYDLSERTRVWEATRLIFPFGEAFQEIITTWARLLKDNPAPVRRFQLMVEKGRETNPFDLENTDRGFFYQDPTTGEEMFSWGVWGGLASKFMGFQDDDPIQLEASGFAASVNLVGQSFLPGVGPVVQVPASFFTRNMEPESTIVKAIYGDFPPPPVDNPIKNIYQALPVPSWLKKFLQAFELGSDEYIRLQTNTTIDVYNALYYAGRVTDGNYDEWKEGMDLAKEYAKTLTLVRSLAAFIGPTGFSNRFEVLAKTPEGRQIIFVSALADEYRQKRDEVYNGDEFATPQYFINQYGINPTSLLVAKTAQVYRTPVTVEGSKWFKENEELFEQYRSTAYFANPDDPTGEFSYEAYLTSLQKEDRVPLTEEQWTRTRNNILGSLAWESFMLSSAPGHKPYWLRSDDQAVADKEIKRMSIRKQYPGWGYGNVPGVEKGAKLEEVIDEFYEWENNQVLSNSEAGKGLALYLKARDNAKMESKRLGYSANGFKNARDLTNVRLYLTDYAEYVINQYPDFQYIWNSYFKRELLEAEQDEQIKAVRANY